MLLQQRECEAWDRARIELPVLRINAALLVTGAPAGAYSSGSARYEKRGVRSNQQYGVAKLGTDGPARRSSLSSPAWWTGPPPIPRRRPPRATNRMTRPPRRSPPQEAARGFWIRAWSQREPALQGTGRSNEPCTMAGVARGWAGRSLSLTPNATHLASNTRSGRCRTALWSLTGRIGSLCLSCENCLLE